MFEYDVGFSVLRPQVYGGYDIGMDVDFWIESIACRL